jgi:predicted DNA-binding protein
MYVNPTTYIYYTRMNMKRTQIFLPENQVERLKKLANGRPIAELIREAIEMYLVSKGA